jgi:hypothetical protein
MEVSFGRANVGIGGIRTTMTNEEWQRHSISSEEDKNETA